jgi:hypothetical protein
MPGLELGASWVAPIGTWVVAGVLLVRGVGGVVDSLIASEPSTFVRLNLRDYSPLCLATSSPPPRQASPTPSSS